MMSNEKISPFASNQEIDQWQAKNCLKCETSYKLNGNEPEMTTLFVKKLIEEGKECRLKAYVDRHRKTGSMPKSIALKIGMNEMMGRLTPRCCAFVFLHEAGAEQSAPAPLTLFDTDDFEKKNSTYDL